MARPKTEVPQLRYHLSGQAFVRIDDRNYYLGKHGSPESFARYAVLIAEYRRSGLSLPTSFDLKSLNPLVESLTGGTAAVPASTHQADEPILVKHLAEAHREWAKIRYAKSQAEMQRAGYICDELTKHSGNVLAEKFGPRALKDQRARWVASGKSRCYCNRLTNYLIRVFKWGVSEELVPGTTWQALRTLEPLREGYTEAHENDPVQPVPIEHVRATLSELSPIVKAMVRVQLATGMRPSEVFNLRPCDIDRTKEVWIYRPSKHKTKSRGKTRAVPLLGDAREAIEDYMNRPADAYCFSPVEAEAWFRAKLRATRTGGGSRKKLSERPQRKPGTQYTALSYRRAIERAAKRAGVPHWHPYQLRHLAGTIVREAIDAEAAQAFLGHARLNMTEHYAKVSERKAIEAAKAAPKL